MPVGSMVGPAVERSAPDAVAWAWGQSIESRYSATVQSGLAGMLVLARLRRKRTRDDAEKLPRFPVIVVCPDRVELYDQAEMIRRNKAGETASPLKTFPRQVQVELKGGLMWKRVDFLEGGRSWTVFLNRPFGGKRAGVVLKLLRDGAAPAVAGATLAN